MFIFMVKVESRFMKIMSLSKKQETTRRVLKWELTLRGPQAASVTVNQRMFCTL